MKNQDQPTKAKASQSDVMSALMSIAKEKRRKGQTSDGKKR